jgi:hypothetical protein
MARPVLTKAQMAALRWLKQHGGDGCFDKYGAAFAQGETAPFLRTTWNGLEALGLLQFYGGARDGGRGYGHLRLIAGSSVE